MKSSPPLSSKSPASSRPSSSASDSAQKDTHTPRSPSQTGLPPLPHFTTSSTHPAGATGSVRVSNTADDSSTSSPQALEEAAASADQETGISASPSGEPAPARQKKKRTRTLTTPHQSAVLHALLAQSRFPTTAMREEVGRSIGLSARKVQVWFQNQRQKARKPRHQGPGPTGRPPLYEPFSSGSQSGIAPVTGPSSSSTPFQGENLQSVRTQQVYQSEGAGQPSGRPPLYLDTQHSFSDVSELSRSRNPSLARPPFQYPSLGRDTDPGPSSAIRSFSPPFAFAAPPSRHPFLESQASFSPDPYHHSRSASMAAMARGSEPPIVLPPLRFDQPRGGQTLPPPPVHHSEPHLRSDTPRSAPLSAHSGSMSSMTSASTSHFHPSFTLPPPPSRHSESIPPPFTLQPAPQWDSSNPIQGSRSALALLTGSLESSPSSSSTRPRRRRTNSDPTRRLPLISMLLEQEDSRDRPPATRPWSQSNVGVTGRRFDPVHAVLREGEAMGGRSITSEDTHSVRRNRHSYHFTGPSTSMVSPSPASDPDDTQGETHEKND